MGHSLLLYYYLHAWCQYNYTTFTKQEQTYIYEDHFMKSLLGEGGLHKCYNGETWRQQVKAYTL